MGIPYRTLHGAARYYTELLKYSQEEHSTLNKTTPQEERTMRHKQRMFEEKGYKLIELNLGFEDLMVKTFEECVKVNKSQTENVPIVSPNPIDLYMEFLTSVVHREYITSIVEKEIDLKLIPTYCYSRKYFQGSTLTSHTDRDACEISLSYCIFGPEWEIHMGDDTVTTKLGNGVIYKGCEIIHGRSKPSSGDVIQIFNHWVISGGVKSHAVYDGDRDNEIFYRGI